jgi:hypothetical protein
MQKTRFKKIKITVSHRILDIHLGPGLYKHAHTINVTFLGGEKQRTAIVLRLDKELEKKQEMTETSNQINSIPFSDIFAVSSVTIIGN